MKSSQKSVKAKEAQDKKVDVALSTSTTASNIIEFPNAKKTAETFPFLTVLNFPLEMAKKYSTLILNIMASKAINPYDQHAEVMQESTKALQDVATTDEEVDFINSIKKMGGEDYSKDLVVIRGLPIGDDLPPTPAKDHRPEKAKGIFESAMLGIIGLVNKFRIYHMKHEKDGNAIQQVVPIESAGNHTGNSVNGLGYHVDNVHEEPKIASFTLGCLRGDKNSKTVFLHADKIVENLPPEDIVILSKPWFTHRAGATYNKKQADALGISLELKDRPILYTDERGKQYIRYNNTSNRSAPSESLSPEQTAMATKAIANLKNVLEKVKPFEHVMEPGDMAMLLGNTRMLHGRDGTASMENPGERRWIQRVMLKDALSNEQGKGASRS